MNYKLMFKSQFVIAEELVGKTPTMKIVDVKLARLEQEDGRQRDKGVLYFEGTDRGVVICKTNALCLVAMFGPETDGWIGKRVTLFSTEVKVGSEKALGIRIKGSPDIKAKIDAEIKLPRKRPFTMVLEPTTARAA